MARGLSLLAPLVLALALAGCALPPVAPPGTLAGRLALQVEAAGDRAAQSVSAAFELRGDADNGELRLNTPLGTTLATAYWGSGDARLVTAQGERRFADLESMSQAAFGEVLPLRALPDWLRGRPWRDAPEAARKLQMGPGFTQLGWTIDLARFDDRRLLAWRAGPPQVRLRAILDAAP